MKNNSTALGPGCDLWVILDQPNSYWWQELNFRSAFLLSALTKNKAHSFTRSVSNETEHILNETHFPKFNFKSNSELIFLATANHFLNRWVCLLEKPEDVESDDFVKNIKSLGCNNIRFFFQKNLSPGLKASFPNCEFVSDSH